MESRFYLDNCSDGDRILFINGIRSDISSGGNTATQTLLRSLRTRCLVKEVIFAPNLSRESMPIFTLKTLPAGLFIAWHRFSRDIWLEFFSRFSPWLLIRLVWNYWNYQPKILIFNHHSTFIFAYIFLLRKRILIWHDIPSVKAGRHSLRTRLDKYICIIMERSFLKMNINSWVISVTEYKFLKKFYKCSPKIFPALDHKPSLRTHKIKDNHWLMIGNWDRNENRSGATEFYLSYADLVKHIEISNQGSFTIAGNGSSTFLNYLYQIHPHVKKLKIKALDRYGNLIEFNELALIAPIREGAGIKLKTLEAWSSNIPVIGTQQAFSGLPMHLWELGGIKVHSEFEMAKFCLDWKSARKAVNMLKPNVAYKEYLNLISVIKGG